MQPEGFLKEVVNKAYRTSVWRMERIFGGKQESLYIWENLGVLINQEIMKRNVFELLILNTSIALYL